MENINNFSNTNLFQNNLNNTKKDFSNGDINIKNEEHFLSLRKKRNNRHINVLRNLNLEHMELSYNLNLNIIINHIKNEEIYLKYKNSGNDFEKFGYINQMILSKNIEILKYGLFELKNYILSIRDKNEFDSKNLLNFFNEKMITYLFELLLQKKSEFKNLEEYYQIVVLLCNIISDLCEFNENYAQLLLKYFPDILEIMRNEGDNYIKSYIYILLSKILLIKNINETDVVHIIQINFFEKVNDELLNIINETNNIASNNILDIKLIYPTLINIIISIINNNSQIIINNSNLNIKKLLYIASFINNYISFCFVETDILKSTLNFLSAFLIFYKLYKNFFDRENDDKFREIMKNIEIEKHIICYLYDNSKNDFEFRKEIIELLNNLILLNNGEFINNLIKNGISEQISKIQDFLLKSEDDYNKNEKYIKLLYNLHIELIYNLISTQSEYAINDLCIENSCISNLFNLIKNPKFCYNNNNLKILEIFDLIIKSKTEDVHNFHNLLLTEGIYDLYKNILFNCNSNELFILILNDITIMIEKGKNRKTSRKINFVSDHFIKNGILDLIDNIKGKNELNDKINYLLEEISILLNEKTL